MNILNQLYVEPREGNGHLGLDGTWDFTWSDYLRECADIAEWPHQASIPGSVYWNLYEAGIMPHPYEGCNSKQYAWVDGKVWYFRKKFTLSPELNKGRAVLSFDGAAYYSRVWVNGSLLGDHSGMFGGPISEIRSLLNFGGENEIVVAIRAANFGGDLPPYSFQDTGNRAIAPWNVVKDAHTSNGDFVVLGLWRPVRIEFLAPMHLARPYLTTQSVDGASARLCLQVELIQAEYDPFSYPREYGSDTYSYTFAYRDGLADAFSGESAQIRVELREKDGGRLALCETRDVNLLDYAKIGVSPGYEEANFVKLDLLLEDARLWNPIGLGDPFLYDVTLVLVQDGNECDRLTFDAGVRTIEFLPTAGNQYRAKWDNFLFRINSRSFFLKGVNWMPLDFLYREEEREYRWILKAVKNAGIQLIRVWSGGGYPESNCFYRICNELGILVWQDNFIANMDTPNWPQDVLQEQVCLALYRLRKHPSLALHCGGNEFNPYTFGNAASMYVIERNIRDLDSSRHFKRTTPDKGSAHIYRDMEPTWFRHCYRQLPFVGESGIHSFPNAKSLRQLMSPEEYNRPIDDMMEESFRDSHPELLNHFTEYVPERVPRMLSRASAITDVSRADIESLAEATQMASAEFYQIMIQGMRENYPVTGGIMLWVLKRSWTTVGIQLIDGLGDPIPPYYYVKNAYSDINAVVALPHLIYAAGEKILLPLSVINESGAQLRHVGIFLDILDDGLVIRRRWQYYIDIPADRFITRVSDEDFCLPEDFRERFFLIRASIYQNGNMVQQSVYWPKCLERMEDEAFRAEYRSGPRNNIVFDKGPWLKDSITRAAKPAHLCCRAEALPSDSGERRYVVMIGNQSENHAFPVCLKVQEDKCVQNASDNYFFLPAGESRQIILDCLDRSGESRPLTLAVSAWNAASTTVVLE